MPRKASVEYADSRSSSYLLNLCPAAQGAHLLRVRRLPISPTVDPPFTPPRSSTLQSLLRVQQSPGGAADQAREHVSEVFRYTARQNRIFFAAWGVHCILWRRVPGLATCRGQAAASAPFRSILLLLLLLLLTSWLLPVFCIRCSNFLEPSSCTVSSTCTRARPCLLYTSPSPRDRTRSRMPSSA